MTHATPTRLFPRTLLLLLLALAAAARAELVDRIAVSVGRRVITQSDLERQIRVVAFQNGVPPDFSPANRHAVADKMIEQKLIQEELESSRYPVPSAAELAPALEDFKKAHYPDDEAYRRALAAAGIAEQDLLDVLLWERTLLSFIELRFESGVVLTDQEIADQAKQNNQTAAQAERTLVSNRADRQVDQWLKDARRRTSVIVHQEAFQ